MTQSPPAKRPVSPRSLLDISPSERRRALIRALITMIVTFFAIIGMYYIIPMGARQFGARSIVLLILAGLAFLAVLAWQVREIFRAEMPGLRAVQAVVVAAPLFHWVRCTLRNPVAIARRFHGTADPDERALLLGRCLQLCGLRGHRTNKQPQSHRCHVTDAGRFGLYCNRRSTLLRRLKDEPAKTSVEF